MARLAPIGMGILVGACSLGAALACSAAKDGAPLTSRSDSGGADTEFALDAPSLLDGELPEAPAERTQDPTTCGEAATLRSYVGCDYWPTITPNSVWSTFDFAVIVANAGASPVDVTITGPNALSRTGTVAAGSLQKFYLPWIPELKGPDSDASGSGLGLRTSILARKSAFHLVATAPVTVYQFNALEYTKSGGPPGKDWSSCPGGATGCYSYSNDASLLLPSTAMTGNYRVAGQRGTEVRTAGGGVTPDNGASMTITATADATTVKVLLSKTGKIVAGAGIAETLPGGVLELSMDAGDVATLMGEGRVSSEPSGSLIQADKPIQVLTGNPCTNQPVDKAACDHTEESVFPYETLGTDYVVTMPTGPKGNTPGHIVRIYGNVNGTRLTYPGATPTNAPLTINAGQVVDLGVVTSDFEVIGDHEIAVGSFMLGGTVLDPVGGVGDPSQSLAVATEQYRTKYVFLAPSDYDVSYVDVVSPKGNVLTLDGAAVSTASKAVAGGWVVYRIKLGAGNQGAHLLETNLPVGIQVMGYGRYTSYQYPGGLNLRAITLPPA